MQIEKFKIKGDETEIIYSVEKKRDKQISHDEHLLKTKDKPLDSLLKVLKNFDKYVKIIAEEPNAKIEVYGISLKWEDDRVGAVIISKKILQKGEMFNIITPYRINQGDGNLMPEGMESDISDLVNEIERFINGARAYKQEELEFQ